MASPKRRCKLTDGSCGVLSPLAHGKLYKDRLEPSTAVPGQAHFRSSTRSGIKKGSIATPKRSDRHSQPWIRDSTKEGCCLNTLAYHSLQSFFNETIVVFIMKQALFLASGFAWLNLASAACCRSNKCLKGTVILGKLLEKMLTHILLNSHCPKRERNRGLRRRPYRDCISPSQRRDRDRYCVRYPICHRPWHRDCH